MKKKMVIALIALVLLAAGTAALYAGGKCNTCGGRGYRTCTPCNGTGQVRKGSSSGSNGTKPVYGQCVTCRGSGTIICNSCNGKGYW